MFQLKSGILSYSASPSADWSFYVEGNGRLSRVKVKLRHHSWCAVRRKGNRVRSRQSSHVPVTCSAVEAGEFRVSQVMIEVMSNQKFPATVPYFSVFSYFSRFQFLKKSSFVYFVLLCFVSDSSCIVLFFKSENGDKTISRLSLFTICLCLSSCSVLNTLLSTPNPAVE